MRPAGLGPHSDCQTIEISTNMTLVVRCGLAATGNGQLGISHEPYPPKLACSCCNCIVHAAVPSRPIERGLPHPGLLAHLLVTKFADYLPLYPQSVISSKTVLSA